MIRWSYAVPRLAAILVILFVAHFGVPPLLRWALTRSVETATGTELDVASVWASLPRGEIRIGELQLSRHATDTNNMLEFDSAKMTLDVTALAQRRYIINEARICGLRFNTPRMATPSSAPQQESSEPHADQMVRRARQHTQAWLQQAAAVLEHRVEDQFESIRLARQLGERWPEDYRQLRQQARQLQQSAAQVHQAFTELSARSDPMNQIKELQQRWSDMLRMRDEIAALRQRSDQLAAQINVDRRAIDIALQRDQANLREKMQLTRLEGEELSDLLLSGEVREWWVRLKPWLELAHWLAESPDANDLGNRGRVVRYDTTSNQPHFLIRAAHLDGQLQLAGHQVAFVGQAHDLSLPSRDGMTRYDRPAQLELVTLGPFKARIHTLLDSVGDVPRQQITLRCDDLPLPERHWGDEDSIRVSVAPSTIQIQAILVSKKGRIDGRLRVTQHAIKLAVQPSTASVCEKLLTPLAGAASSIGQVDLWMDISGTFDEPRWQLRSDLGPQLEVHLQHAAQQAVRDVAARLTAEADQCLERNLAQSQHRLTGDQEALHQQLGAAAQLLSELTEPVAARFLQGIRF